MRHAVGTGGSRSGLTAMRRAARGHGAGCRLARVPVVLVLLALVVGAPVPARAAVFPFAWLIEDGVQFTPFVSGLPAWSAPGVTLDDLRVFPIVDGQVDKNAPPIGTARLWVWGRTTATDPYAATFGPLAALAVLTFQVGPAQFMDARLGLVQTPSGAFKTTIGVVNSSYGPDPSVRGAWLVGNGATIGGADASDLVVAGFWVADTPLSLGVASLDVSLLWASPGVAEPTGEAACSSPVTDSGGCVGSFFGITALFGQAEKVRADTARFPSLSSSWAHLLVIDAGDEEYLVVACTSFAYEFYSIALAKSCTLSGTGPLAGALSGRVDYARPPGSISTTLTVEAFLVSPGIP
jgi:hypothetical protein